MPDLLVSSISPLLGKLATMMSDEYKMLKDVRGDIKLLKDELEMMHAFLLKMTKVEAPDEQAKLRVRDVRELSYDIEDSIDKFMVNVDRESSTKSRGFKKLIEKSKNLIHDIKIRHQIAKEVKDIKNQVMEASERFARYKVDGASSDTRNTVVDPRVIAMFTDASELVGTDGPRDELIKWLNHDEHESITHLKVLSVVGFGGLGKTTLANQVVHKIRGNFDCVAVVSISQNPHMTQILGSILSQISNDKVSARMTTEGIITQIRDFLNDKRYFIVVDDIWDVSTWEILRCAFVKNSCGNQVMITTRKNEVAESCSSSHNLVYRIKPLADPDSRMLFFKRIFGSEERCPSDLREASLEILKKCGGLPLAVITISSLLATRKTKDLWDQVRKSIGFAFGVSSEVDGMRGILSLSYTDLPHHLRSCVLYLALFPEDCIIQRSRLVYRWIAEGFIHGKDGQDLVELGDMYFHELVNRSFVQPAQIGYDGKADFCRVHDTILDFLNHKSAEENFGTVLSSDSKALHLPEGKVRRLSLLVNNSEGNVNMSPKLNTCHLRSLGAFGSTKQLPSIMEFHYLRVLDLQGCNEVQNHHLINIGRLSLLRYLNIFWTGITELPANIGDLQYLETLCASNYPPVKLPETVTQLKKLVCLDTLSKLPDGIGNLKNLQELGKINTSEYSLSFLQELGELINLRRLSISWNSDVVGGDKACHVEKLVNLVDFAIEFDVIEQQDIQLIERIPTLVELEMWIEGTSNKGPIVIRGGFQQLKKFVFYCGTTGLIFLEGAMPMLKDLQLNFIPEKFKSAVGSFDCGIQHLPCLANVFIELVRLRCGDKTIKEAESAFRSMVETHTNRPTLEVKISGLGCGDETIKEVESAFRSMVETHTKGPTLEVKISRLQE